MPRVVFAHPEKKVSVEDIPPTAMNENQIRVRTAFSYLSAGTELTVLQMGLVNMEAPVPHLPLGYSLAGEVIEVGAKVTQVKPGDRVACVGAGAHHATEVVVARNLVVPIPDQVSMREAAVAAMMCFALEGVRKARIAFGENVLVLGAGPMGQIASQLALASGGNVYMMDRNAHRLARAVEGIKTVQDDDAGWDQVKSETAPVGVEVGLLCFGGDATAAFGRLKEAMTVAADGVPHGRVVSPGGATITVQLASASGNIEILSSAKAGPGYRDGAYESGAHYPIGYVKWTVTRNVQVLLRAVARKQLRIEPLISHEFPYEDAPAAYAKLAEPDTDALITLFRYN